jgi:hypothetical protein
VVLGAFLFKKQPELQPHSTSPTIKKPLIGWGVFILGIILICLQLSSVFNEFAIDMRYSDVIPSLDIYPSRLLSGEYVYKIQDFGEYELTPGYLPMKWLPFVISKYFGFDHRWMASIVLFIGLGFYQHFVNTRATSVLSLIVMTLLPFFVLYKFSDSYPAAFGWSAETVDLGYYLILFASIFSKSNLFRAIAILLCLLSRYSFVFWLPLYFLLVYFIENRRAALTIAAYVIVGVLLIFVIPFLSKDWNLLAKNQQDYYNAALGEWYTPNLYQDGEPRHLFSGIGFAGFFRTYLHTENETKIEIIKRCGLILSILASILYGLFFLKKRLSYNYKIYLLLALKFYFVIFYTFIQVPYPYLFMIPIFLSLFLANLAIISKSE